MKYFQEQFDALLEHRSDEDRALRDLRIKAFNDFKSINRRFTKNEIRFNNIS